jgi:uncharacterized RDD family membrane protein YckC
MENEQRDLLVDDDVYLEQASGGKRFANYIIDLIIFYILAIAVFVGIALVNPTTIDNIDSNSSGFGSIMDRVISLILYGVFMGIIEAITKGRSIGKFITGTKVVNEDGSNISVSTAFTRRISRAVPFEAFSALGSPSYPWHDKWSNTYVIDIKNSRLPNDIS